MYQHIKQSIQDGIAQIVMDRPASNNALDAQMFRDLIAAVEHCDADEAVKVIILTGAGKNFSAGGDIKEMATFEFISYELSMLTGQASLALRKCRKPVIAMVNGTAAGAGCGLALGADFRIMTERHSGGRGLRARARCRFPHHDGRELSAHSVLERRPARGHGLHLPPASDCRPCEDD